ncbi:MULTISPECIES: hypothetical protein [unclassified Paludibacterium]|uniref:hypothetical protein n=1 Tax=unclassified Paludibacterium TaxID=2618429 RepID=UPI001C04168E|nr:hypothetical protein [Paludibacterium sp. B53371]BEV71639.1 hypothetical protein THUN1379_11210 [Paludibacterium sp. THUN1379]
MTTDAQASTELKRVAALRQGIRTVAAYAFKINLLGLNALLLAKRYGANARGFGVISSELRDFSKVLHGEMATLGESGGHLIDLESQRLKMARQVALISQTCAALAHCGLEGALAQKRQIGEQVGKRVEQEHEQMRENMARAYQACLYGSVLARSAQIEAAYAGAHGNALTLASQEFTHYIDDILDSLESLKKAIGERG